MYMSDPQTDTNMPVQATVLVQYDQLLVYKYQILDAFSSGGSGKKPVRRRRIRIAAVLSQAFRQPVGNTDLLSMRAVLAKFQLDDRCVWVCEAMVAEAGLPDRKIDPMATRAAFERADAGLSGAEQSAVDEIRKYGVATKVSETRSSLRSNRRTEQKEAAVRVVEELSAQREKQGSEFLLSEQMKALASDFSVEKFIELGATYLRLSGKSLTMALAIKSLGLKGAPAVAIKVAYAEYRKDILDAKVAEKKARALRRTWEKSLLPSRQIPELLKITRADYQRWLADGRLKVALYREFTKWGKSLETPMFDPKVLEALTAQTLAKWRSDDLIVKTGNRKAGAALGAPKAARTKKIKAALHLEKYGDSFEVARGMKRDVVLCLGPTNSGKTYEAMSALAKASSGLYLAPLRLLALEAYEKLMAAGVPANLVTGEERIFNKLAMHTCSTIEMCDFQEAVEVAVVDEVQLICDKNRGAAWTAALLGAPAKMVFACGAGHSESQVTRLLAGTGDTVSIRRFERKNPLHVMGKTVGLGGVQAGDALIAFSRRDVLQLASSLRDKGFSVSVIYGALSAEVRRSQVQAFAAGRTDVVVATDAIGMGVNLPIRRIIFTDVRKYDGQAMRSLSVAEVQQIAGRAGRFGLHEIGLVGAFRSSDLAFVSSAMSASPAVLTGPFLVMPTWEHVRHAMLHLPTSSVVEAIEFFDRISFGGDFQKADLAPMLDKARFVGECGLSPRAQFRLACAPADLDNTGDRQVLTDAVNAIDDASTMDMPRCPVQLDGGTYTGKKLSDAEGHSRRLTLFAWLGCAFPGLADLDGLADHRAALAEFINRALEVQREGDVEKRQHGRRQRVEYFEDDDGDDF